MDIFEELLDAKNKGIPCALATIVETIGCAPRSAGTKMLVYSDGKTVGTVGGGSAEKRCISDCIDAIRSGRPQLIKYSPENEEEDCKKTELVFIEPYSAVSHLYLCGSGHIAQALLPLAKKAGFYCTVFDTSDMESYADKLAGADELVELSEFSQLSEMDLIPQSFYVVCSYSHKADSEIVESIIEKNSAYIGLLGAKHKFMPIFDNLRSKGIPENRIRDIYAPAGLDIGGQTPNDIAVSIIAEMMSVKYARTCIPLRDKKRKDYFGD